MDDIEEKSLISSTEAGSTGSEESPVSSIDIEEARGEESSSNHKDFELEVEEEKKPMSFFATTMNMLNCLLGAGILSISSTFNDSGILLSIFLLILVALITQFATHLTFEIGYETGAHGFDDMARIILGKWGLGINSAMVMIFNTCACLAYLILGADFIISWFAAAGIDLSSSLYRAIVVFVYSLLIPIALSIPRSFQFLSYFSGVVFGCIIFFVIVMIYEGIYIIPKSGISPTIIYGKMDLDFFSSISVYGTAFALPICCMPVIHDYDPSPKKRSIVSAWSLALCFLTMLVPGVIGYLIFGSSSNGSIINNFPDDSIIWIIVRVGFFIVVSFSYPITVCCVTSSWAQIFYKENNASDLPTKPRIVVLIISNIIPLVIAMFLPVMRPALEVGGALGGCIGNYVFPAIMWLKLTKDKLSHWKSVLSIIVAIFGIITAVISTYIAVVGAVDAFKTVSFS